ncbi:small nuclear ribonucleoprotein [Purpureocillium lilacinum]|uniref:Sm protein F n=1 Tax=Purpureocillium lilacinum TaxID=33203 RepID=A0A2U3ELD3_PURLI|nr:small nuclear ribonucleoprotein [Purpureocillium lilacinum]
MVDLALHNAFTRQEAHQYRSCAHQPAEDTSPVINEPSSLLPTLEQTHHISCASHRMRPPVPRIVDHSAAASLAGRKKNDAAHRRRLHMWTHDLSEMDREREQADAHTRGGCYRMTARAYPPGLMVLGVMHAEEPRYGWGERAFRGRLCWEWRIMPHGGGVVDRVSSEATRTGRGWRREHPGQNIEGTSRVGAGDEGSRLTRTERKSQELREQRAREIKSRYELETPLSWEFVYVHGFHVELRFGKGWCGHASVLQEPEDPGFDAALRGDAASRQTTTTASPSRPKTATREPDSRTAQTPTRHCTSPRQAVTHRDAPRSRNPQPPTDKMSFVPVNPRPMLQDLVDKHVSVRLKWGQTEYQGVLKAIDSYMNLQLSGTREVIDNKETGVLGQVLIRCNNVLWIRGVDGTEISDAEMKD